MSFDFVRFCCLRFYISVYVDVLWHIYGAMVLMRCSLYCQLSD